VAEKQPFLLLLVCFSFFLPHFLAWFSCYIIVLIFFRPLLITGLIIWWKTRRITQLIKLNRITKVGLILGWPNISLHGLENYFSFYKAYMGLKTIQELFQFLQSLHGLENNSIDLIEYAYNCWAYIMSSK
jgi:hypothetical protein